MIYKNKFSSIFFKFIFNFIFSQPDFAPVHFSIHHVPCNVNITGTWTAIDACANSLQIK